MAKRKKQPVVKKHMMKMKGGHMMTNAQMRKMMKSKQEAIDESFNEEGRKDTEKDAQNLWQKERDPRLLCQCSEENYYWSAPLNRQY